MGLLSSIPLEQVELEYLEHDQVLTRYILPLGEVVIDFYDRLKSVTKGYASLEYVSDGYQDANVVKLTFNLNGSAVHASPLHAHTYIHTHALTHSPTHTHAPTHIHTHTYTHTHTHLRTDTHTHTLSLVHTHR